MLQPLISMRYLRRPNKSWSYPPEWPWPPRVWQSWDCPWLRYLIGWVQYSVRGGSEIPPTHSHIGSGPLPNRQNAKLHRTHFQLSGFENCIYEIYSQWIVSDSYSRPMCTLKFFWQMFEFESQQDFGQKNIWEKVNYACKRHHLCKNTDCSLW